ncbi:sugar phosphate nucleotidyltransferase [Dactylosporangium sp. CA-139066]|uniref:sugar phosphate nucleotidyltransferase n=1 Tax=Dactylosporangium sp. CA-139066 TaxID=3239930 RepID=UPI003D8D8989
MDALTGIVLAGGRGTRLGALTERTSKQLLPVGGRPLVCRAIDQLVAAGIEDVLVVIDERHATQFLGTLRDGRGIGLRSLGFAWQPARGAGLPSAIGRVERLLRTDKFIAVCGDVLVEDSLERAVRAFAVQDRGARMVATHTADTAGQTTLAVGGPLVRALGDKDPDRHGPGLMDMGFYCYHRDVFDRIRALRPSGRGETEIWDLNRAYAARGELWWTEISGWWSDVGGSPEAYRAADSRFARIDALKSHS